MPRQQWKQMRAFNAASVSWRQLKPPLRRLQQRLTATAAAAAASSAAGLAALAAASAAHVPPVLEQRRLQQQQAVAAACCVRTAVGHGLHAAGGAPLLRPSMPMTLRPPSCRPCTCLAARAAAGTGLAPATTCSS